MNQSWYDAANLNNNWYNNKGFTNNMDIPKCISCDNFIVNSGDLDLCSKCLSYIEKRNNSNVQDFINSFSDKMVSFDIDHIPEFSVITANVKNESFLTVGVDWREALITDVVEEDFSNEIIKNNLMQKAEEDLVNFIFELGNLMYSDIFDNDALRSVDVELDSVVQRILKTNHNPQTPIVAWKAVDVIDFHQWKKDGFIPKGEVFSLAKYFSFEKKSSNSKNKILLKIFVSKKDVYMKRNNSIEVKEKLHINDENVNIV
jgi:hypothetical protein